MRAGRCNTKIIFEKKTTAPDVFGDAIETWVEVEEGWAEIKPQSGREFIQAKEIHSSLTHLLTSRCRCLLDITEKMRIKTNGIYLEIIAPPYDPTMRKREMRLLCRVVD